MLNKSFTINYLTIGQIPALEIFQTSAEDDAPKNMVIGYHGYTNVKESILTQGIAYAKRGYHVILPDAYLHGKRKPNRQFNHQVDLLDAISHNVQEFSYISQWVSDHYDSASLSIFGTSMGGITVAFITGKYADQLSGASQYIATIDGLHLLNKSTVGKYREADALTEEDKQRRDQAIDYLKAYNLADQVDQLIKVPFYAYNGGADDWVDADINRELIPQIQKAHPQAQIEFEIYEAEDHWVPFDIINKSADYLKQTNPNM